MAAAPAAPAAAAPRAFRAAPAGAATGQQLAGSHMIRIVSYNVLADKYSSFQAAYCPPEHLEWQRRWPSLQRELERYDADLLLLQEVEQPVFEQQLEPWLRARGFASLWHPRASPPGLAGPDEGVSLHFRSSAFTQVAAAGVRFADAAAGALPAACCRRHARAGAGGRFAEALAQRGEGFLMALLRHEPSQRPLLVCSTHLHWNPQWPDVKLAQASAMCHAIRQFLDEHQQQLPRPAPRAAADGVPTIIGGDFNSLWRKWKSDEWDQVPPGGALESGVYRLLQQGAVPPTHHDHPANRSCAGCGAPGSSPPVDGQRSPTGGRAAVGATGGAPPPASGSRGSAGGANGSSGGGGGGGDGSGGSADAELVHHTLTAAGLELESSHFLAHGREPALTTRTNTFSGTLDYIWLSRHWGVASTLEMPYRDPKGPGPHAVPELGPLPSAALPSDHLAVGCDAVLLAARRGPRATARCGGRE